MLALGATFSPYTDWISCMYLAQYPRLPFCGLFYIQLTVLCFNPMKMTPNIMHLSLVQTKPAPFFLAPEPNPVTIFDSTHIVRPLYQTKIVPHFIPQDKPNICHISVHQTKRMPYFIALIQTSRTFHSTEVTKTFAIAFIPRLR